MSSSNIEKAKELLQSVRQHQRDWLDYGSDRVYLWWDLEDTPPELIKVVESRNTK